MGPDEIAAMTLMPQMTGAAALHVLLLRISQEQDTYEVYGWTADTLFTRADMDLYIYYQRKYIYIIKNFVINLTAVETRTPVFFRKNSLPCATLCKNDALVRVLPFNVAIVDLH